MAMDQWTRSAIDRLTENEKDCLRRWLRLQTAKEMAIDLGVSPHAIEKRLKMARAKLGVSSSLSAARLLATVEQTQRLVPQSAALSPARASDQVRNAVDEPFRTILLGWQRRSTPIGVLPMPLLAAIIAASLPQASAPVLPSSPPSAMTDARGDKRTYRPAPPDEVRAFVADSFRTMDKDGTGFIEDSEAPESGQINGTPGRIGDPVPSSASVTIVHGRAGRAMWIAIFDTDEDGRVSEAEFAAVQTPTFLRLGVPVNWRGAKAAATATAR